MRKLISLLLILSLLSLSFVSATWTYQEDADVNLWTGGQVLNPTNAYDGDWNTSAQCQQLNNCNYYENYTVTDWEEDFILKSKQQNNIYNESIPDSCLHMDVLELRSVITDTHFQHHECFNGTSWTSFGNTTTNLYITEQALWKSNVVVLENYTNVSLPQLSSNVSLDTVGIERTYLLCTWRIDGIGEEAVYMQSELCPEQQQYYDFDDDEDYMVIINYAKIRYDGNQWQTLEIGNASKLNIEYILNVPEPSQGFFDSLADSIIDIIKSFLCSIFPSLGLCS